MTTWTHAETGAGAQIVARTSAAAAGSLTPDTLRATALMSCAGIASLVGTVRRESVEGGRVTFEVPARLESLPASDRLIAALALRDALTRLAVDAGWDGSDPGAVATGRPRDVGNPYLVGAAVIVVAGGIAAGAWIASRAIDTIDRAVNRYQDDQQIAQTSAIAAGVAAEHSAREVAMGRALPLSAGEREVFTLLRGQLDATNRRRPMPTASGEWATGGALVGVAAVAALAAYLTLR